MTYVAADCYLRPEAKLGFVITQSVFKTVGGGVGFRRFALPSGESLGVESVHDLVELQPFEGATNRTATFVAVRGRRTEYPIPYYEWTRRSSVSPEMDLEQVRASVSTEMKEARPIVEDDVTSPWTTVAPGLAKTLDLLMGSSAYRARAGVCGWYNGIFWVEKLRELSGDKVLVANSATSGKKSVERVEAVLERKHLFPLLRGREIDRWHATPHLFLVAPVVVGDESKALSEGTLRRESPHTYAYLNRYREDLAARNGYKKYLAAQPFYAQYNIGPYSFAKYQVAWLRISNDLCAAVVTGAVPDNGVTAVALESLEEADYLCALMNCTPVRWAIARFSVAGTGTWGSPQILTRLAIPRFDPSNEIHAALSRDAASCRKMTSGENLEGLESHEQGIDDSSARLFRISKAELRQIQSAVSTISKRTRLRRGRDSDDEG